jgi:hypothetical protein
MRIIGGHDYYDIGMSAGHDEHVVFVREKDRTLSIDDAHKNGIFEGSVNFRFEDDTTGEGISRNGTSSFRHSGCNYDFCLMSVVIANKRYGGIRFRRSCFNLFEREEVYFWGRTSLETWLGKHGLRIMDRRDDWRRVDDRSVRLDDYFDPVTLPKRTVDYLVANRIAVMSFTGEGEFDWIRQKMRVFWRVNADSLKALQFYRALDAYSIFQEIEMWLGGVVAPAGNPVVVITDDRIKRDKHGFDKFILKKMKQRA